MSTPLSTKELSEQQDRELFRKLTRVVSDKLGDDDDVYFPPIFDKQFFCSLWEELNKTIAPEIKYNVSRSQMKRGEMIEKCLENRKAVIREIRNMENRWSGEEYIQANTMNEVLSTGTRGIVDFGINIDGKVVKFGTAFVIKPKLEEGKSLIAVMSLNNEIYTYELVGNPYNYKPHTIMSYPWNLMRRNMHEDIEEKIDFFTTCIPELSDVGRLHCYLIANSKKRSIEEVDESALVETNRKLVKLSNQLKKENEELIEAQLELENENLKQKNLLRALKAMMETADL